MYVKVVYMCNNKNFFVYYMFLYVTFVTERGRVD